MNLFAERLRKLRKERNIRQAQLGDYLGYGATAIVNYESGRNEPSMDNLIKLAEYFAVSVGYLVGSEKEPDAGSALPREEQELLFAFSCLSAEERGLLLKLLKNSIPPEKMREDGTPFGIEEKGGGKKEKNLSKRD